MEFTFDPIGIVRSCFTGKFGIPRQSGMVPDAAGVLELLPPYNKSETVRGLEGFSHIWITFVFHENAGLPWKGTVRPPRLGGNRRIGVFASSYDQDIEVEVYQISDEVGRGAASFPLEINKL